METGISALECTVVQTALTEMHRQGVDVILFTDSNLYAIQRGKLTSNGRVCLLSDGEGNLEDIAPLLDFVPRELRESYIRIRGYPS